MEILDVAKKLGAAIQEHELYKAYAAAKQKNDDDKELQDLIEDRPAFEERAKKVLVNLKKEF